MRDPLGDRMKGYESVTSHFLISRMPIMIRVDGKAFHTFTHNFEKPYDSKLSYIFDEVCRDLFNIIQGLQIAYTQSDEISLFLHTYNKFNTQVYFNGKIQKIASVVVSEVTSLFINHMLSIDINDIDFPSFDCRVWNIPKEEVYNYFLWRGNDASRNAILSYAHEKFGHKFCQDKKTRELLQIIPDEDWDNVLDRHKFGSMYISDLRQENISLQLFNTYIKEQYDLINDIVNYQEDE